MEANGLERSRAKHLNNIHTSTPAAKSPSGTKRKDHEAQEADTEIEKEKDQKLKQMKR